MTRQSDPFADARRAEQIDKLLGRTRDSGSKALTVDDLAEGGAVYKAILTMLDTIGLTKGGTLTTKAQPSLYLNGNNGANIDWTAGQQVLTSAYMSVESQRGGIAWDSTTGMVSVPQDGRYLISSTMYVIVGGTNGNGRFQIQVNGGLATVLQTGNGADGIVSVTLTQDLKAGDQISIIADGFDLATTYMGAGHARFFCYKMG